MNIKDLKNLDKEEILELLGIGGGSTSGALWTIGLIALGAVAGASAALLLTPKTGRDLREALGQRAKDAADDIWTACDKGNKTSKAGAER